MMDPVVWVAKLEKLTPPSYADPWWGRQYFSWCTLEESLAPDFQTATQATIKLLQQFSSFRLPAHEYENQQLENDIRIPEHKHKSHSPLQKKHYCLPGKGACLECRPVWHKHHGPLTENTDMLQDTIGKKLKHKSAPNFKRLGRYGSSNNKSIVNYNVHHFL